MGALSWGAPDYGQLDERLEKQSDEQVLRTLRYLRNQGEFSDDRFMQEAIDNASLDSRGRGSVEELRALVELRAVARGEKSQPQAGPANSVATAQEIKKSPFYRDQGVKEQANWLAGAMDRLRNLNWSCDQKTPEMQGPNFVIGPWLTYGMWGVLGVAVGFFVYMAFRHFKWVGNLERRAKALLDDDEPERTVDEWLKLADDLERQGKYREAVRCLYLACLLRIDEARIARFDRGQTNWEHLYRIERSPKRPPGLDFRPATKAFDLIWYGMREAKTEDIASFRGWYNDVLSKTRAVAA